MRKRSKFHRNFSESGACGVSTAGDVIPNGLSRALRKAEGLYGATETATVIFAACMLVHEMRGPEGQFGWYRGFYQFVPDAGYCVWGFFYFIGFHRKFLRNFP